MVVPLVAHAGELAIGHARPANRTGTVGRINDRLITQVANLAQGIIEQACDLAFAVGIEVGASDVADKQGVTGKHANGFLGKFSVEQCVGKMIECMARRLQYADFELADPVAVPLACRSAEHTSELQSLMRISYA